MTENRYKAMIEASGGSTPKTRRAGDRPQPLHAAEETALSKAWEIVAVTASSKPSQSSDSDELIQEKRSA